MGKKFMSNENDFQFDSWNDQNNFLNNQNDWWSDNSSFSNENNTSNFNQDLIPPTEDL